jgi:hypothetical protein
MWKLVVVLLAISPLVCGKKITGDVFQAEDNRKAVTDAVVDVILSFYIETTSVLDIITLSTDYEADHRTDDIVSEIILQLDSKVSFLLDDGKSIEITDRRKTYNIIFVDSYESFSIIYNQMITKYFQYRGYFLIVLAKFTKRQHREVKQIFDALWLKYIIHANIILVDERTPNECKMLTYFPYSTTFCEEVHPTLWNT